MEKNPRILLVTASIGSGHIRAADAVRAELAKLLPQADIAQVDFMSRRTSAIHWLMKEIYLLMLAFVPNLYDYCYKFSSGGSGGGIVQMAFSAVMSHRMSKLLKEYQPDLVICTHPFPEGAAAFLKRIQKKNFPLFAVLTDYSLHQIWIYSQVNAYFCATEPMRAGLLAKGFPLETVHAVGIPIDSACRAVDDEERHSLRQSFSLSEEDTMVLLMGGGLGLGGIESVLVELEQVERRLTIFVVAGRNEELEHRTEELATESKHDIRVHGYSKDVTRFMQAADLLITKPGALTISEAFAVGVPMLLREPIPGPEVENAAYAVHHKAARFVRGGQSLAAVVTELFDHPEERARMRESARYASRPGAAREIAKEACRWLL